MTVERPLANAESVHGYLRRICFKTGPPGRVGAELEWLVARQDDPRSVVRLEHLNALLDEAAPFPGASRITMEPGGQVELSSLPAADAYGCHASLAQDMGHLESVLGAAGLALVPSGIDPDRPPRRQLHGARYDAMAAYFDTLPHDLGPVMMASTAAVQVNLDAGADAEDVARRWKLLHAVGPVLSAAFANSPRHHGRPTGWKSTRQAVWLHLDPRRTQAPPDGDPATTWPAYVLAAPVMMLRTDRGPWLPAPGFTFGEWVGGRVRGLAPPTKDDLDYHLSTLFPPVRPRGWFEVRYLDAQAPEWWPVPVAVLTSLLQRSDLTSCVAEACEPVSGAWESAARHGLADAAMARAALSLFEAVVDAVEDPHLRSTVVRFMERYVGRGRCPADDAVASAPPREHPTRTGLTPGPAPGPAPTGEPILSTLAQEP